MIQILHITSLILLVTLICITFPCNILSRHLWKSNDKNIQTAEHVKFGDKAFCTHKLEKGTETNMAICKNCKAVFIIVNCKYEEKE